MSAHSSHVLIVSICYKYLLYLYNPEILPLGWRRPVWFGVNPQSVEEWNTGQNRRERSGVLYRDIQRIWHFGLHSSYPRLFCH